MQQANRLEMEMKHWQGREQRFSKLFSPSILHSRAFKKEKLHHLEQLYSRYRWTANGDERLTRNLLQQERRQLEKELYPTRLKRNFRRLVSAFNKLVVVLIKPPGNVQDRHKLGAELEKAGFKQALDKLNQKMRLGQKEFSISLVKHINEKEQLQYSLEFSKNDSGQTSFSHYTVRIMDDAGKMDHTLSLATGNQQPDAKQLYNLLSGRLVQVKTANDNKWLSVDFNDKDAKGNLRLRSFETKSGPDILAELEKLPIKENRFAVAKAALAEGLRNGERMEVTILNKGKEHSCFIEINANRTLNLYNPEGKKITLTEALGKQENLKKQKSIKLNLGADNKVGIKDGHRPGKGIKISRS